MKSYLFLYGKYPLRLLWQVHQRKNLLVPRLQNPPRLHLPPLGHPLPEVQGACLRVLTIATQKYIPTTMKSLKYIFTLSAVCLLLAGCAGTEIQQSTAVRPGAGFTHAGVQWTEEAVAQWRAAPQHTPEMQKAISLHIYQAFHNPTVNTPATVYKVERVNQYVRVHCGVGLLKAHWYCEWDTYSNALRMWSGAPRILQQQ